MSSKEILQKRFRKLIKMERNARGCIDSDARRPPNPSYQAKSRTLRLPPSYLNRPLPPNNPYQLRDDQRVFKLPATLESKTTRKQDKTESRVSCFEPVTICNLDPQFYTIVEGRAIRPNHDLLFYMKNIRDIFMNRANRGYLVDGSICIEAAARTEGEFFLDADNLFSETKRNFLNFLREDHKSAAIAQEKAKAMKESLADKQDELEAITFRFVELRSALLAIRMNCITLTKYRKFLNSISPLWWRDLHDEDYISEKELWRSRAFPSVFFPPFELPDYEDDEEVEITLDPLLYFESPNQLMEGVYEYMENQCLNYLRSNARMAPFLKKIVQLRDEYSDRFAEEVRSISELSEMYEERAVASEKQALEFRRLFEEQSRKTVLELMCSKETIMLEFSVQWVYEQLFKESMDQHEVRAMARGIQALYLRLTSDLDLLECDVVRAAERENFAKDARAMRNAHHAHAQLVQWENLKRSLHSAFDPPPPKSRLNSIRKNIKKTLPA